MRTLQNHKALIICAETESGRSIAERLAALGAEIILQTHESDEPKFRLLISTIKAMGAKVKLIAAEVDSEDKLNAFYQNLKTDPGNINIIASSYEGNDINTHLTAAINQIADYGRLIFIVQATANSKFKSTLATIEALAKAHSPRNVTVNMIVVQKDGFEVFHRATNLSDIADAAEFFAGDLAGLVTAQFLVVNGTGLPA